MQAAPRRRLALPVSLLAVTLTLFLGAPAAAQNGQLAGKRLAPVSVAQPCAQLANRAAAAWNTMALYNGATLPVTGCDSAYRPLARQEFWRAWWCARLLCGNAAVPGTSNHGLGIAVDVPRWVRDRVDRIGFRFGWCKYRHGTCGPSDAAHEWWHIRWTAGVWRRRPNPGVNVRYPVLRRGSGGIGQAKHVRRAQRRLRAHGRRVRVTGQLGPRTCRKLKRFKRARRLRGGCVTDRRTWRRLERPPRAKHRTRRK